MKTNITQTMKRSVAVALLVACLGALTAAFAQLDPGMMTIVENGVQVGEIYVPPRGDQGLYSVPHRSPFPSIAAL